MKTINNKNTLISGRACDVPTNKSFLLINNSEWNGRAKHGVRYSVTVDHDLKEVSNAQ